MNSFSVVKIGSEKGEKKTHEKRTFMWLFMQNIKSL